MKLNKIIQCLEKWAPPIYQESYDNSGLMVGDYESEISGCLISLDCTEKIVDEAISKNCNLIISHHPIIFGGISSINSSHWICLLYTSPSPRDLSTSRMPSSA